MLAHSLRHLRSMREPPQQTLIGKSIRVFLRGNRQEGGNLYFQGACSKNGIGLIFWGSL